jgi:hypothetical protein
VPKATLAEMVKGPVAIGLQEVVVAADGTVGERHRDRREGLRAAASGANAVAWRVELGCEPRCQGVFGHQWQHPAASRREAPRPLCPRGLGPIDAPHRGGVPGVRPPESIAPLGTLVRRGHAFPVAPWRRPPPVALGHTPHRHEGLGVTA